MVEVGSADTHSRRRIFHILGQNAAGRAGRLLVSELYGDAGCWSGYPPHKHDMERAPEETGRVRWAVEVFNQRDELVATYDLLTENVP